MRRRWTAFLTFACLVSATAAQAAPAAINPVPAPASSNRVPPPAVARKVIAPVPVLLVHGIDDTGAIFHKMVPALIAAGRQRVDTIDLAPNNGDVGLRELAAQVGRRIEAIRRETRAERVDLVGFSLGGMVSRYYVQKLGGTRTVRRFVTIASPHRGTYAAFFRWNPGAADMRPGSAFLNELEASAEALRQVEMTSIWTPLDTMILPSWSSRLPGARERIIPVLSHPWMVVDKRVCRAVVEAIDGVPDPVR
jgi:triacylglycerol lipase